MIDLFMEGGVLMMSLISLLLLAMVGFSIISRGASTKEGRRPFQRTIQILARMAASLGALSFLIGMYSGLEIYANNDLSPQILAGGTRVAMISLCYGLMVYLVGQIIILIDQRTRS